MKVIRNLWKEDGGQDLVEYGLLLVLVALFAIAGMKAFAGAISNVFGSATNALQNPIGGS